MTLFIALDRPTPPLLNLAGIVSEPIHAIVPCVAMDEMDLQLVPFVPKQNACHGELWRRLAKHKLVSQQLLAHIKAILAGDGPAQLRVKDVHAEVIKRMGVNFDADRNRNMYRFFHKHLARLVWNMTIMKKRRRRRAPERTPLQFTTHADAASESCDRTAG